MADCPDKEDWVAEVVQLISRALTLADEAGDFVLAAKLDDCLSIAQEQAKQGK